MQHRQISPLRLARLSRGVTQEELADSLGVCRWTVMRWELGRTHPSNADIAAAADALHVEIGALVGR